MISMKSSESDCPRTVNFSKFIWWFVAILNIILVEETFRLLRSASLPHEYSYLNNDRPITVPMGSLPKVEMTFHESYRFDLTNQLDANSSWNTLWTNQGRGTGFQHLGPFQHRTITAMYHNLHCLIRMQRDLDKPPNMHFQHCLGLLRQTLLCNADMTLERGDFMKKDYSRERVGETRVCRDWSAVADWMKDEFRSWVHSYGLEIDDLPPLPPIEEQSDSAWAE